MYWIANTGKRKYYNLMTILHATPEKYQNKLYIITVKSFVENVIQSYVWLDLSIDKAKYIKGLRLQSFKPFDCDLFTLYWHFIFQHRSVPLCMGNHPRQIDSMELHSRNKLLLKLLINEFLQAILHLLLII